MAIRDYPIWDGGWIVARAANALLDVAQKFRQAGEECQGKFMLDYIGGFFIDAALFLWSVVSKLLDADKELWFTKERIRDIVEDGGIRGLLQNLWGEWQELTSDPARWVRMMIVRPLGWGGWYANSWESLFQRITEQFFPTINDLLRDPRGWVLARVGDFMTGVNDFLNRPVEKIIEWLNARAEWFGAFLRDPWQKVLDWAQARNYALWQWLGDPVLQMQTNIENYLKLPHAFWNDPVGVGVRWAQDTLLSYIARNRHEFMEWLDRTITDILEREYW